MTRQPVISAASGHDRWLPTKRPTGQFYLSQEGKLKKIRAAAGVCVNYFGGVYVSESVDCRQSRRGRRNL